MYAQTDGSYSIILNFTVKNHNGEPIGKAAVKSLGALGKIRAFSFANNEGEVTIKTIETDTIEISSMGYRPLRKLAKELFNDSDRTVFLEESTNELREIVVKVPPIKQKNDTIIYDAKSFMARGDLHLEDILKKMPGLSVSENGSVSYQGKAINKFYIEGKDLLGSGYTQATRNMPAEAINSVEVYENHQPIKMLKDKQMSDKAALNIRLDKNNRSRPFGEASIAAGGSPFIWNDNLFLTQINTNSQFLLTAKANNTGTDISTDVSERLDVGDPFSYETFPTEVFRRSSSTENIPTDRYVDNNSQYAGINFLTTPADNSSLRVNVNFFHDRSTATRQSSNIFGGINDVSQFENRYAENSRHIVMSHLKYERNTDTRYLTDEIRYSFSNYKNLGKVYDNYSHIEEKSKSRPSNAQNYFRGIFLIGDRNIDIKSFFRYLDRSETLGSEADSISFYDVEEVLALRHVSFRNSATTTLNINKGSLRLGCNVNFRQIDYDYHSVASRRDLVGGVTPSYLYGNNGVWSVSIAMPIELIHSSINGNRRDIADKNKVFLNPSLTYRREITNNLRITIKGGMNADLQQTPFYSPFRIRTSYRTLLIPDSNLNISRMHNIGLQLSHRNLVNLLFANASVSYQKRRYSVWNNYEYTDTATIISVTAGKNNTESLEARISIDKTFINAGLSSGMQISYNKSSYMVSQSGLLTNNHSDMYVIDLNIDFHYLKWMRFITEAHGYIIRSNNDIFGSSTRRSIKADVSLLVFPLSKLEIKGKSNYYLNQISASGYKHFGLVDMAARYVISKRCDCSMQISNILNIKDYTISTDNAINRSVIMLPLRGREYLFTIGYRF